MSAWSIDQGVILQEIPLRRSDLSSEDSWIVIDSISDFALKARREGGFNTTELVPEILWNSQVTRLYNQINQNGVAGYIGNVIAGDLEDPQSSDMNRKATEHGLECLGDDERLKLFREIWSTFDENRAAFVKARQDCKLLKTDETTVISDRWYKLDSVSFLKNRVTWIRSLSKVHIISDADYPEYLQRLWLQNPLKDQRLQELRAIEEAQRAEFERISRNQARLKAELFSALESRPGRTQTSSFGWLHRLFRGTST